MRAKYESFLSVRGEFVYQLLEYMSVRLGYGWGRGGGVGGSVRILFSEKASVFFIRADQLCESTDGVFGPQAAMVWVVFYGFTLRGGLSLCRGVSPRGVEGVPNGRRLRVYRRVRRRAYNLRHLTSILQRRRRDRALWNIRKTARYGPAGDQVR